ncbi:MAG: SusC/RagA family TonB-linked outer membrane protein, partial [Bacteroides sp.]
VKGEGRGTITDIDGNYSIEASSGDKLEFSYMGYKNKTLVVGNATQYNINLSEDTQLLDEVVVIGYGTQNKKTLTGAVSVVKMDASPVGTLSSASHGLAGKAAGMRVNMASAQPGGAVKIRIRGEGSDMGSNEPLVVIDGFPIQPTGTLGSGSVYNAGSTDNVLESLNPEDIESITVLKDAASTAIYGARAGHGVILVTTKRGTERALSVNYSTNMAVHSIANNYEMLNAPQFMDMFNRQQYEQYMKENGLGIYEGYISTPSVIPSFQPRYSNDEILRAKTTDWLDEVTRTGFMQQHNVSMTGGTKTTKYLLSANYMKQEGVVKNNNASRMSVRLNLDQEVSKYINVGVTANYTQNQYDNVPLGNGNLENSGILTSAIQANPTLPIRDSEGNYTLDPARSYVPNPVSLLEISDKTVKDRIMAMGYVKIKPIKELELKLNLGADRKFQKRTSY